jgi:hypothetical protein
LQLFVLGIKFGLAEFWKGTVLTPPTNLMRMLPRALERLPDSEASCAFNSDYVRSKTNVAMVNEVLCKIICHNICCLIQESHELGIDTIFWAETSPAQKGAVN